MEQKTRNNIMRISSFRVAPRPKFFIIACAIASLIYFCVITFWFKIENVYLFALLMFGQLFYLWQGLNYLFTVWEMEHTPQFDEEFKHPVDVFITVAGEPIPIIEETVRAALAMDYPNFEVYILNDGYVAKKENWADVERMARKYGAHCHCITRRTPGGAKAGNINNALKETSNPYVAIFDADHVPHPEFLKKTMGYFTDAKMGFVQTPQYYKNCALNETTRGAWDQQQIYYGPICKGRNRFQSVTMCGTNMVLNRTAITQVGGMCDFNIAEDFITGMFIHEKGWKSFYVPQILAQGLAPEDMLSYYKQQLRWARGSLELLFKFNPLFRRGLSMGQKLTYLTASSYYLTGLVVLINITLPLIFFFTGLVPFAVSTMALAAVFIPYICLMIYVVQQSTNYSYTFEALSFSMSSFFIHLHALVLVILGRHNTFAVTSKTKLDGNFIRFATTHLLYISLVACGIIVAVSRAGITTSLVTNSAWALLNITIFTPFIASAVPESAKESLRDARREIGSDAVMTKRKQYRYADLAK